MGRLPEIRQGDRSARLRILVMATCRWWNATAEGALLQARALAGAGAEVLLTGQPGSPILDRARDAGLDTRAPALSGASFVSGLAMLGRLLRQFQPHFICAHRSEDHLAAAVVRGRIPLARIRSDIRRPVRSCASRLLDSRTTVEVYSSPFMLRAGYGKGRRGPVEVIPQAVDTDRFHPTDLPGRAGTLVIAARFSEVKGHGTLIRALRHAPGAKLVVAGAGAQLSEGDLRAVAEAEGVADRVEFTGYLADVRDAYSRASIGVVPSLASEAVSRAALEMMSSGLPVLAASTNGLVDVVLDGRTGILHPPGDSAALGRQIAYLCADPGLVDLLGRNARRTCEELYSLDSVGARWTALLRDHIREA